MDALFVFLLKIAIDKLMLPSGFEPESEPREGSMIGHYTTGAKLFAFIHLKQPVVLGFLDFR